MATPIKTSTKGFVTTVPSPKPPVKTFGATDINGVFSMPDALRVNPKQDRVRWYRVASGSAHVPVPDQGFQRAVIIGVNNTGAPRTVTLPSEDIGREGTLFIVKDESGGANSNNITIATEGSQTIDGAGTQTISTAYGVCRMYSDGTNLFTW